jgi:hypothetical protein
MSDNCSLWSLTKGLVVVATMVLLKVKLVIELKALEATTTIVGPKVPRDVLDHIRRYIPASPIIAQHHRIFHGDNPEESIQDLDKQICALIKRAGSLRRAYKPDLAFFHTAAGGLDADPKTHGGSSAF